MDTSIFSVFKEEFLYTKDIAKEIQHIFIVNGGVIYKSELVVENNHKFGLCYMLHIKYEKLPSDLSPNRLIYHKYKFDIEGKSIFFYLMNVAQLLTE